MNLEAILKENFNSRFYLEQKNKNLFQLFLPLYHEDGDMIDIFIEILNNNTLRISDCGMTLMRLSYTFDIDTDSKQKTLDTIIKENDISMNNGNIYIETNKDFLLHSVMQLSQAIAKISNMKILTKTHIQTMFYEMVEEYISSDVFEKYKPEKNYLPLAKETDLTVDYALNTNTNKPIFIYAVKGNDKAKSAMISLLLFQQQKIPFISLIANENYDSLQATTKKSIMRVADKQFFNFEDFKNDSPTFIERFTATQ